MKTIGDIELVGGSILNLNAESLATDPAFTADDEGRIIYNTTTNEYRFNNGSEWVAFQSDAVSSSTTLRDTLGTEWVNSNFSFNPTQLNLFDNVSGLTSNSSLYDALNQLDSAITTSLNVTKLQDVDLDFTSGLEVNNIVYYNGSEFVNGTVNDLDLVELDLSELDDVTFSSLKANEIAAYNGSEWVNRPLVYTFDDLSGANQVFNVNHNLGTRFVSVTIFDRALGGVKTLDPSSLTSIVMSDDNNLTVTLNRNTRVTILVIGMALS